MYFTDFPLLNVELLFAFPSIALVLLSGLGLGHTSQGSWLDVCRSRLAVVRVVWTTGLARQRLGCAKESTGRRS